MEVSQSSHADIVVVQPAETEKDKVIPILFTSCKPNLPGLFVVYLPSQWKNLKDLKY